MIRRPPQDSPLRLLGAWAAALTLAFSLAAATDSAAAIGQEDQQEREAGSASDTRREQVEAWRGRFCTPTGCAGTDESPWGSAAGFGVVVLATGWIARRQPTRNA